MVFFKIRFPRKEYGTNKLLTSYIVFMTKVNMMYVLLHFQVFIASSIVKNEETIYMISVICLSQTSRAEILF